jgi:hypothetical protein
MAEVREFGILSRHDVEIQIATPKAGGNVRNYGVGTF